MCRGKEIRRRVWRRSTAACSCLLYTSYVATKERIYADYEDRMAWAKKMLINISKAGFFSSDRTIAQYNEEIWKLS